MSSTSWTWAALVVAAYLVGSIPFGVLVTRALGAVDPRTAGSRNIGFTNVVRVSGKTAGVLTLAGDLGKGWLAGWSAHMLLGDELAVLTVALSVILGHIYSVFVRFRGGKGVATAIGAVLGVAPWTGAAVLGVWLAWFALFRYSSGAALLSFGMLPVLAWAMGEGAEFVGFSVAVAAMIVFRHKENMVRLWHGTEPRVGGQELT